MGITCTKQSVTKQPITKPFIDPPPYEHTVLFKLDKCGIIHTEELEKNGRLGMKYILDSIKKLPIELKLSIVQFLPIDVVIQFDFITAIGLAKNDEKVSIVVIPHLDIVKYLHSIGKDCTTCHDTGHVKMASWT